MKTVLSSLWVFEGINGCGKSTLLSELTTTARAAGKTVRVYRDPGSCPLGERLRTIIKNGETPVCGGAQLLLFTAGRVELANQIIEDHKREPVDYIFLDRWVYSTLAYQVAHGSNPVEVTDLHERYVPLRVEAGHAILLDIPVAVSRQRTAQAAGQQDVAKDRFEAAGDPYLEKVRNRYLAQAHDGSLKAFDATMARLDVFAKVAHYMGLR